MDENECALMKFIHDDVGDGDLVIINWQSCLRMSFMTIGPQMFFQYLY
jgi:hypothetical protein